MKKIIVLLSIFVVLSTQAMAFLYEIPVLTKAEIVKLSDEDLVETYIEVKIEEKASKEFHRAAGFSSAKDYNKRKNLLRFLFELRLEMSKRGQIKAGSLDELLR
ncbi:hypothetical protein MNBD_UNCLBAC01-1113 [hydrothermal vent metagenome]|uniref:Uncharacterized protein n=1 Tax=hydrothermal vent metagenome TaxID=652676 RepID=A0A3B1D196_9ZZZZ